MEYLKSSSIRVPGGGDKVYKDECVYCFNSPVHFIFITRASLSVFSCLACVAGGFGGRESRAKTSGAAAGEMGREPRQSRRSRVNERLLVALAPFPRGIATRFGPRARLSGEPNHKNRQLRRLSAVLPHTQAKLLFTIYGFATSSELRDESK